MANAWLAHVKSTMADMKRKGTYKKGQGLKQVIKAAKATYKKHAAHSGAVKHTRRHRRHSRKTFGMF
uniref:Uncharacterized protein n=1 Tax=viral metagenome TaxID=1070528 RepID=A0A6C0J310_9ZZZZ